MIQKYNNLPNNVRNAFISDFIIGMLANEVERELKSRQTGNTSYGDMESYMPELSIKCVVTAKIKEKCLTFVEKNIVIYIDKFF